MIGKCLTKEETIEIWEESGLLMGIENETLKEKTALILEDMAKKLIDNGTPDRSNPFEMVIFPIGRRVISEIFNGNHKSRGRKWESLDFEKIALQIDAQYIIDKASNWYDTVMLTFKTIGKSRNSDWEAEGALFISEWIAIQFIYDYVDANK